MPKLSKADQAKKVSITESRRRKEAALARLREMAADQMAGKLIDRRLVESTWFEKARLIRDGILNVPDRLAALLASISDERQVHQLLDAELRKVLTDLGDRVVAE